MKLFLEMVSIMAGIAVVVVGTVILLTLFFCLLNWFSKKSKPQARTSLELDQNWVTIYMVGGKIFEGVRFLGNTTLDGDAFVDVEVRERRYFEPFELAVFEDKNRIRYWVRKQNIEMIVVDGKNNVGVDSPTK